MEEQISFEKYVRSVLFFIKIYVIVILPFTFFTYIEVLNISDNMKKIDKIEMKLDTINKKINK